MILASFRQSFSRCAHLGHWGATVAHPCVTPDGVHQRVCGERVVGGPQTHVLLEAFGDRPIGPDIKTQDESCCGQQGPQKPITDLWLFDDDFPGIPHIIQKQSVVCLWCCDKARRRNDQLNVCVCVCFYSSHRLVFLHLLFKECLQFFTSSHLLPEHIMVAVDLLPFLRVLQYPTVPHHSAANTLRVVAAILPVVQHLPVGGRVEEREGVHQSCRPTNQRKNLGECH